MLKLLPHQFKKIGAIIAPLGFFLWISMQVGWISELCYFIGVKDPKPINIATAVIGFFSFLLGTYALTFSKEKVEDELIKSIRLESFQFSALLQIVFLILGLILIGVIPPGEGGLTLFFIVAIFIFWITYIIRFNYIIYIGIYKNEK